MRVPSPAAGMMTTTFMRAQVYEQIRREFKSHKIDCRTKKSSPSVLHPFSGANPARKNLQQHLPRHPKRIRVCVGGQFNRLGVPAANRDHKRRAEFSHAAHHHTIALLQPCMG